MDFQDFPDLKIIRMTQIIGKNMTENSDRSLFLLDGMALVYRAYFAFQNNPIRNSRGENTSAMFGFINTLLDVIERQKPTHVAVALDTREPTFRHKIFPEYKAQREEMPEDLVSALPQVRECLNAMSIPLLELDGFEADDLIGTIAQRAASEGFQVTMVTPDKDFAQLVTQNILLLRPGRKGGEHEIFDVEAVRDKWDIDQPEQIIDILGLWGDSSDNIPGVPGIGQKTASKLIKQFHSVDGILANLDKLKGKQKENLEKFADQARLSRELATIHVDVPYDLDLEATRFTRDDFNGPDLQKLIVQLEFNAIGKKLFGDDFKAGRGFSDEKGEQQGDLFASDDQGTINPVTGASLKSLEDVPHDYTLTNSLSDLKKLVGTLKKAEAVCFDTETSSLDPHVTELLGIAWSTAPGKAGYITIPERTSPDFDPWIAVIQSLFAHESIIWIGHNLKFDLIVMARHGVKVKGQLFDTMIAHALIEPDQRHGMDFLSESLLGYAPISITSLIGADKKNQISMKEVPLDQVAEYAAEDADVTFQLFQLFQKQLNEKEVSSVFYDIEMPLLPVLVSMEIAGVAIDSSALHDISHNLGQSIEKLQSEIFSQAGEEFNLNSPKQLGIVLFDNLKIIEKPKKTRTGQYATNEQVLVSLASVHPIVQNILDYRAFTKLKSTYVDSLPSHVKSETGRIHTSFGQVYTATGRLQSQDPNLQNIPIRSAEGREIRRAFVPTSANSIILSADYSQIELRIIAAISGDEGMCQAFENGTDIHAATSSRVFGVSLDGVTSEMRRKAKMVNFGIAYGISAFGLAQRLGIPRGEAKEIIDQYFAQFPGIRKYLDETIELARAQGYVSTLCGRRRYIPEVYSSNATVRGAAERNAINTPIQGTAADMIKIAMAKVASAMSEAELKAQLILQVHDELVFECPLNEVDSLSALVKDQMESAIPMSVPIVAEVGFGKNWLEAH